MKRSLLFLVALIFTLSISAEVIELSGTENSLELISSDSQVSVFQLQLGSFNREAVEIEGSTWWRVGLSGETRSSELGSPELPIAVRNLAIPDTGLMELEILASEYIEMEMPVAPSRGVLLRNVDPAAIPFEFGGQYQEDSFYPGTLATLQTPYIFRDIRGIAINIYPLQYNGASGMLRVYTNLTLAVNNSGTDQINIKESRGEIQKEFVELYRRHFMNWEFYQSLLRYDQISEEAGRMVIISFGDFMEAMQPLVDWKMQKGIATSIVDVTTIGNNSTSIQNFISAEYDEGGLVWVLLVGDGAQVATKTYSGAGGDPQYTYLEGTDSYSEIFIGRFSAETVAQVETQVQRSVYYERDVTEGDWMQKGIGIASSQGSGQGHYGEADYVHIGYIRDDLLDYGYLEVDEIYDTNGGNATMVANALNEGRGIINYCGHGSNTTWSTTGFSNSHINALTNDFMLPFISSVACVNGNFTSTTCFAEAWMRATNGDAPTGAIAIFASSINQSWAPPMYAQDESVDLMVADELNTLGGLWFNGVSYMLDESGADDMAKTWHIFGDPSLQVRSIEPIAIEIDHLPTAFIGLPTFEVSTDAAAAMYCLSYEGEIIDSGYADESGEILIDMSNAPVMPADLTLTITAYNRISSAETLQLLPNEGPYLLLHAYMVDSDGDEVIDAGETVEISLNIENLGSDQATDAIITMEINDPYITVTDGIEELGNIPSETVLNLENIFSFEVSEDINFGHPFEMTITMSCDEDEWIETYVLASYAPPGLWITPDDLDFELEPGEQGTSQIEISNYRDEPVHYSIRTEAVSGRSIEGSYVACSTNHFEPGQNVVWTFSVSNLSLDNEWVLGAMINFPTGVEIISVSDFIGGTGGPLEWDGVSGNGVEVNWYGATPSGYGRLRHGETAYSEVEVQINQGFTGQLEMEWRINGDGYGQPPHDIFGEMVLDYPLSWIILSGFEGTLNYGEASVIGVTINTAEMETGIHQCEIVITDNRLETRIPVTVEVMPVNSNDEGEILHHTQVLGNYPNPFNPETDILFTLAETGAVEITIYNVRGQLVETIMAHNLSAGDHQIKWQGTDFSGRQVSSGIYFYKFRNGDYTTTKKMILMK